MSEVTIKKLYYKSGYATVVDFLNKEGKTPTPGAHSSTVEKVFNFIQAKDIRFFVTELYVDESTFSAVLMAFQDSIIIVRQNDLVPLYAVTDPNIVRLLYDVNEEKGLQKFYSTTIPLQTLTGDSFTHHLQIYNRISYGAERYFTVIKDNDDTPIYTGVLSARLVDNPVLGSYTVQIDKLNNALIEVTSLVDHTFNVSIALSERDVEEYNFRVLGQKVYIPDTPATRQRVKKFIAERLVSVKFPS